MKIKYLIEKEFKQMIMDSFMPKLILSSVHDDDIDALGGRP